MRVSCQRKTCLYLYIVLETIFSFRLLQMFNNTEHVFSVLFSYNVYNYQAISQSMLFSRENYFQVTVQLVDFSHILNQKK